MTLEEAVQEVLLRVNQHKTEIVLDWDTVATFINRARREVLTKTLAYKDWGYTKKVAVSHGAKLPEDYIRFQRVYLRPAGGSGEYKEARYADPQEYFNVSDWRQANSWNKGSLREPVFTIWGANDGSDGLVFYASPNGDHQPSVPPTGFTVYSGNDLEGFMEVYADYGDETDPTATLNVPYEYEDLLIILAVSRVYHKLNDQQKLLATQQEVMQEQRKLQERYMTRSTTDKLNLESFPMQEAPFAGAAPTTQTPVEGGQ